MNRTIGLLIALAFSFAMQAFAEDVVENVFSSDGTRALTDPEGWSSGKIPSVEEGVVISGGGGVAILSPEQGYSSYTVKSGATLLVGPERTLSDVTLEAGSKLVVATSVVYKCSGYINNEKENPTTFGSMPTNCDLTKITNIKGFIGGTTWTADLQGAPYSNVYLFDLTKFDPTESGDYSQTLICQFQNYIKDYDGNHTKGVVVELKKDSSGKITAYVTAARYFNNTNGLGKDLRKGSSSGTIAVSDSGGYGVKDVSFSVPISENGKTVSGGSLSAKGEGSVEIEVAENCIFDLSNAEISMEAGLVKTGAGTIVFGKTLPEQLSVESGILALQLDVPYDMSNVTIGKKAQLMGFFENEIVFVRSVPADGGKIKYQKSGGMFHYTGDQEIPQDGFSALKVSGGKTEFVLDSSVSAEVLSEVVVDSGSTLKILSPVDIRKLVLNGDASLIVGENGDVKLRSFELTEQDGLKPSMDILAGGRMTVFGDGGLPSISLSGNAALEIGSKVELTDWVFTESYSEEGELVAIPSLTIFEDATLSVPGGSKFGGMKLAVYGTLQTVGDGALTLGFSKIFEETVFGLVVDGGTIRVASGVLKFLCPDGSIVVPDNTITFKDAKMEAGSGKWLQPHFCDTLPIEQSILFDCDNTLIDFATGSYILRGSTIFKFKNGGGIIKSNTAVGNPAALWIVDNVKISMLDGASFIYGEAQAGQSVGGSALGFQPTEDGFESFSISDGEILWHRTGGNGSHGQYQGRNVGGNWKAKIRLNNVVFKTAWGTHSRGQIFDLFKEVELENGGLTIIADPNSNSKELAIDAPLTGKGGVYVYNNNEKIDLFKLTLRKENTATGSFILGENVRLILTEASNWKGTFPWSDQVEIYKFQKEEPFDMTFGGLNLSKPLVYRIWKDGNDKINFVGEGIIPNGNEVQIQLKGGYNPPAGTSFDLGAVSDDFDIDSVINKNDKWKFEVVENDDGKHLRVSVREIDEAKLVFNGGSEGSVSDLNDTNGWAGGVVPSGQDVSIDGVALEISYDVPEFSSVTLKNGAKITVVKDISLPSLNLMSGTELIVKSGYVLTLPAAPSVSFEDSDSFSLPVIKIEEGGTLLLPTTSNFRGMKIDIQGTLKMLNKGDLVFGYAYAGEVVPFGLSINGGSVILPEGNINFACPEEGGTVVAADGYPWNVVSATLTPGIAYGFNFGKGNDDTKEINVVFENTRLPYSTTGVYYIQGALSVSLKNDSVLYKDNNTGYGESMLYVEDKSKLVFDNATLYWGAGAHGGSVGSGALYLNPIEDNWCSLEIKNSLFFYHHLTSSRKAVIKLDNAIYNCNYTTWNYLMPFHGKDVGNDDGAYNPAYIDLSGDVKFHLRKSNINMLVPQNVSFKGVGGIVLACPGEKDRVSTLAILNGENTALGAVIADNGCKVYFNDGANWAGTVVANGNAHVYNKYADNVYTHDSPVTVSFAKLDLQSDFPVKVWKDEEGKITGNDTLNVGEYINNGGCLVPEMATENGEFVLGDKIVVGEIGDSSPLPRVAKGWTASRKTIDGKSMLVLSKGVGFLMIVR